MFPHRKAKFKCKQSIGNQLNYNSKYKFIRNQLSYSSSSPR